MCRARAAESRSFAVAASSSRQRAIWIEVAEAWEAAAVDPSLHRRAVLLAARAAPELD